MIGEVARALADETALAPADVYAVFLFGKGFPWECGGPLNHAARIGLPWAAAVTRAPVDEDARHRQLPPMRARLVDTGGHLSRGKPQ